MIDSMPPPPARELSPPIWFLAPFARLPLPAWVICLLISLTTTALYLAMEFIYTAADPTHRVLPENRKNRPRFGWRSGYGNGYGHARRGLRIAEVT